VQRRTRQRETILACFLEEDRPLSPREAHALAAASLPALGIATVYRAINGFLAEGLLSPVVVGGATCYERADKAPHHHFFCQTCHQTTCLDACSIEAPKLVPEGYRVQGHELTVTGTCPACHQREAQVGP